MPATPQELTTRFAENPDDHVAFEFLEERLFMEADWPGLADLYRRRLLAPSLARLSTARAELALRLGQIYEDRLADTDASIAAYSEAIRLDPKLRRALQHLRRLYAARRSWTVVLQISEQQLALAESGEERARIYSEMGDIWQRELGEPAHAATCYEWARAESAGSAPPDEEADADQRGGEVAAEAGTDADPDLVQAAWLAAARGESEAAIAGLTRALDRDPADVEALDMMFSLLEGAERPLEMARMLERRAGLASDPETRGAVLVRLGSIREDLGDLDEAREAYERALEAAPGNAGARAALARTYRRLEAWSALRTLLEGSLGFAEGAARIDLLCELAAVLETQLDEPEAARDRLEQVLAMDPDEPRAAAALSRIGENGAALTMPDLDTEPAGAEQRSNRIVGVLERKLARQDALGQGDGPEARRLRLRIAELRAGALGEPAAAVAMLEPLAAQGATLLEAAPMLAGLYEQLGRTEELVALSERAAALCVAPEEEVFWNRRAADAARLIGDPRRAIRSYQNVLRVRPSDRGAREALCELYRSLDEVEPLLEMLHEELPRAAEARELEIQLELATLAAESLGDERGALAHLRRCLALDPGRRGLLEWALELCGRQGGSLAQLDLIEHVADQATESSARAALIAQRGALLADALGWQHEANESWRAALDLDPKQPVALARSGAVPAETAL